MPEPSVPSFTEWSSFPFEGKLRVKKLADPVAQEPPRQGEDQSECAKCHTPDSAYIWVDDNWRVRSLDRPSGLPMVLILETRSHLDLGDLPNLLAGELGIMVVRLERAIRSLDGVAQVHVNRWGDAAAHLHLWFLARPYGRLQLRGTFLSMWDEILPPVPEYQWRENLALVAAWLADFGGQQIAEPPRINWQTPSSLDQLSRSATAGTPESRTSASTGPTGFGAAVADGATITEPGAPVSDGLRSDEQPVSGVREEPDSDAEQGSVGSGGASTDEDPSPDHRPPSAPAGGPTGTGPVVADPDPSRAHQV